MITVLETIRAMGVEPTDKLVWNVGTAASELYERTVGALPAKELRQKKNGGGTHCHAIYPDAWRSKIVEIVRAHQTEEAKQRTFEL